MRGFEQCSTSGSSVSVKPLRPRSWHSHSVRHCGRQRTCIAAADSKDTQLAQQAQGGQQLARSGSENFMQRKINFNEASDGSWVDKVDDWGSFWEEDEYLVFEDEQLDDSYDGLTMGSARNTELLTKAQDAITNNLLSSKWREKHPDVIHWMPYPTQKEYDPDIPEPEPLPEKHWDEVELRAWLEKRRWRAIKDAEWHERHQNIGRYSVLNVTEQNDTRLMPRHELSRSWSHAEIWDLILNGGKNADPDDVPMKVYDPLSRADYFSEGIQYFPETEEWLAESGHWWEDEVEPDLDQEVSMLASDFSDINVGNNADNADDQTGDADNEDEAATSPDDEAAELGNHFGQTDL